MGLLAADLASHRQRLIPAHALRKEARVKEELRPLDLLRGSLELYAGAELTLEKSASTEDHTRLFQLHAGVEKAYRDAVKEGKKPEADALLDKFAGWKYLKGAPGQVGDKHPLPAPESP